MIQSVVHYRNWLCVGDSMEIGLGYGPFSFGGLSGTLILIVLQWTNIAVGCEHSTHHGTTNRNRTPLLYWCGLHCMNEVQSDPPWKLYWRVASNAMIWSSHKQIHTSMLASELCMKKNKSIAYNSCRYYIYDSHTLYVVRFIFYYL